MAGVAEGGREPEPDGTFVLMKVVSRTAERKVDDATELSAPQLDDGIVELFCEIVAARAAVLVAPRQLDFSLAVAEVDVDGLGISEVSPAVRERLWPAVVDTPTPGDEERGFADHSRSRRRD